MGGYLKRRPVSRRTQDIQPNLAPVPLLSSKPLPLPSVRTPSSLRYLASQLKGEGLGQTHGPPFSFPSNQRKIWSKREFCGMFFASFTSFTGFSSFSPLHTSHPTSRPISFTPMLCDLRKSSFLTSHNFPT